jgi:hypothetical protein
MGEDIVKMLKNSLTAYEKSIKKTDENYDALKKLGRYDITHPYLNKHSLSSALDRYEKKGIYLSEIRVEYERINRKLEAFEQKRGRKNVRDKLFEVLKYEVNTYYTTICYFLELDPIDLETENDMDGRDILEILLVELDRDYDLHDIKIKVTALDEVLKCQFRLKINTIMKECPSIEREHYPDSFWWRHPSKILHDLEESRKKSALT